MGFLKMKEVIRPSDGFAMECVDKPDAVAVVLFNTNYTKVLLVKQFRAGAVGHDALLIGNINPELSDGEIYELPAGVVEHNEDPHDTMFREVREETGYLLEDVIDVVDLGVYFVSPGYTSEKMHLFRARVAPSAKVQALLPDDDEDIITEWVDVANINKLSIDMKTQMGITKAMALPKTKIGIYGGSFNPVTHLHLLTLERAIEELELDFCIIEPVGDRYIKKELIAAKHRIAMLELAAKDNTKLKIGHFEMDQLVQPNTINTLNHYKEMYGWCEIYFICGSDNLKDMVKRPWPNYNRILGEFNIICVQRDNDNVYQDIILHDKHMVEFKNNIYVIHENVVNNISASAIRNLVRANMSIKYLLPALVENYIKENKLYLDK